jgi:hypothetical protein
VVAQPDRKVKVPIRLRSQYSGAGMTRSTDMRSFSPLALVQHQSIAERQQQQCPWRLHNITSMSPACHPTPSPWWPVPLLVRGLLYATHPASIAPSWMWLTRRQQQLPVQCGSCMAGSTARSMATGASSAQGSAPPGMPPCARCMACCCCNVHATPASSWQRCSAGVQYAPGDESTLADYCTCCTVGCLFV